MAMGMAPTAGECVDASMTSVPAGVMGRPSPAGSCRHHAPAQKHRQIRRKPPVVARDFIGLFLQTEKRFLAKHFAAALDLQSPSLRENCFTNFTTHIYRIRCAVWQRI